MPADFVSELAERAFKKSAAGTGDAIVVILPDRPQDAATLANQLNSRPDLQAQVSSFAGYTPSEWLLEHELAQVEERRIAFGKAWKRRNDISETSYCHPAGASPA